MYGNGNNLNTVHGVSIVGHNTPEQMLTMSITLHIFYPVICPFKDFIHQLMGGLHGLITIFDQTIIGQVVELFEVIIYNVNWIYFTQFHLCVSS